MTCKNRTSANKHKRFAVRWELNPVVVEELRSCPGLPNAIQRLGLGPRPLGFRGGPDAATSSPELWSSAPPAVMYGPRVLSRVYAEPQNVIQTIYCVFPDRRRIACGPENIKTAWTCL